MTLYMYIVIMVFPAEREPGEVNKEGWTVFLEERMKATTILK